MPVTNSAILTRGLLALSGEAAMDFLQNIISAKVGAAPLTYALLLTPQGKVRFDFFLWQLDQTLILDCAQEDQDGLHKALLGYRLRAPVDITAASGYVQVGWDGAKPIDTAHMDTRLAALGWRALHLGTSQAPNAIAHWQAHRIGLGICESARELGNGFPLEYRLDAYNAIDFHKGCFIGQEVCARSWRLGKVRKRTHILSFDTPAPEPGTPVQTADMRTAGEIRATAGTQAIALLHENFLKQTLHANGMRVATHTPPTPKTVHAHV